MNLLRYGWATGLCGLVLATGAVAAGAQALSSPQTQANAFTASFGSASNPVDKLVALYRLEDISRLLSPQQMDAALAKMKATPGIGPLLEAEITSQQAMTALRRGQAEAAGSDWRGLGEVEHWQAVGPFDNSSPDAINSEAGPEKSTQIDLKATYQGKQRQVGWRNIPYSPTLGIIDLAAYLSPQQSASAYLVSWVRSDKDQAVALRLRDSGATRLWVNGELVFHEQGSHPSDGFDQHAAGTQLHAGWNEILAKVGDGETSDWKFSLRVTTPEGAALALESSATPEAITAAGASAPAVAVRDLSVLAAAAPPLEHAWVLSHKHNFNTGDHDDVNAFTAAVAAAGSAAWAGAILDFAEHDSDLSRRYENLQTLLAREPGNRRALLDVGMVEASRAEYWPARAAFWSALGQTDAPGITAGNAGVAPAAAIAAAPQAALGMFECYAGMGSRPVAMAWAQALEAAGATPPAIATPVAVTLRRMSEYAAAEHWLELAHAQDAANLSTAMADADAQREAGNLTMAFTTLQAAEKLDGSLPSLLDAEARALAGLARQPEALATIHQAIALAPDTPALRVAAGDIERHFGHAAIATEDWQTAVNLNPQDSNLRDRLRIAKGGEATAEASFERPYTQDLDKAMAAYKALPASQRSQLEGGPVVVLASTTVNNVFPSGNVGRYVQEIFRVNNTSGANALAVYAVTYDPGTQDVHFLTAHVVHADGSTADAPEAGDQPIQQSVGYETFYDVRNKYVQMPPLRAGDFVEIAYRLLPNTLESLYGDYFGDIATFGSSAPTLYQRYVVITPADKHLYFKAIRFPGEHQQATAQGQTVYQWTAINLAPQIEEPLATPDIEQQPYIAVSAFQTWDQFANWYRQLIHDTFVTDSEMAATVNQLIAGKTTEAEKVDAIYRWVIQNTHYVALEFGIHGYRPYPVTQVFHRRYGDCKDKASLLIAMLHQAGISAEFVLVRIRDLGLVDATIPSVADFDHAICYVPSLNLYLDGTAEYEGANELPAGDQRAFVLRLPVQRLLAGSGGAATAVPVAQTTVADASTAIAPNVTPEQPPTANVTSRVLNGQLDAQGNLRFQMDMIVTGGDAPELRQALELPDRRAGAIQAMLHDRLPGISVNHATVKNDGDWDQPIEVDFDGTIPRFATVNGGSVLIPRQILPKQWLPAMAALGQRTTDVLTGPPEILLEEMHVSLPTGLQFGALPPPTQLTQPFATMQADANLNGSTLTLRSRIETKQALIPPATYPAFRTFWSQVDQTLGRPINATLKGGAQ